MNKIFKVIYSKVKHMYVVASELAKSHGCGKSSGRVRGRALAALVAASLAAVSLMAAPMTAEAINDSTAGQNNTSHSVKKHSWVVAGNANDAEGENSVILGGNTNATFDYEIDASHTAGTDSTILGGYKIYAIGESSVAGGGWGGLATGDNSTKLGGWNGVVQGMDSTGIDGGSTGDKARYALAMGYGAVVTNDGVTPGTTSTGYYNPVNVSTALGYEATADAPGTIAVGHDKGDAAGWNVTYSYDSYGNLDTTKAPTITAKDPYTESYYNRIVKMADGIDAHDAVTMEQMTTNDNTKADVAADNIGSKLKVTKKDSSGNTVTDSTTGLPVMTDATDAEKTENETAWGTALGTGSVAENNGQLVTGGTVYTAMLGRADTDLSNLTTKGHTQIYTDAQEAVSVVDGAKTTVSSVTEGNTKKYSVNVSLGDVASGDAGLVTGGKVFDAIQKAQLSGGGTTVDISGKADATAGNVGCNFSNFSSSATTDEEKQKEVTANETAWGKAIGTGAVAASGDTSNQLVTGSTVYNAIKSQASWNLTAGGTNSSAVTPGTTVDFSAAADSKDGTADHSNLTVSKASDSASVKIGLNKNVILGESSSGNGGSLDIYTPAGTDQLGTHTSLNGSTMNILYKNSTGDSDVRGVVLGVASDSSNPLGYMYLADGDNYYYIHGTMKTDPSALQGRLAYRSSLTGYNYIANLNDGLKFAGDTANTTVGTKLDPTSTINTLTISGGVSDASKLTSGNIGVVAAANTTDSTGTTAGGLSVRLAKDLAGITSISNQTTTDGTTTGAKVTLGTDGNISVNNGKITDVASNITKGTDGKYTVADADKNNAASISDVQSLIKEASDSADTSLAGKADISADNIGANLKGSDGTSAASADEIRTNENSWGKAIGTGEIADSTAKDAETNGSEQLVTGGKVYEALHGGLDNIVIGKDGKDGKDGSIGIAGKDGANGYSITTIKTEQGKPGVDGKDGITRIVYQKDGSTDKETVATLDDGMKFAGDDGQKDSTKAIVKKLDETLNISGGADSAKLTEGNIGVNSDGTGLKIQLAQNLTGITSISNQTTTDGTTTGAKITLNTDGSTDFNGGKISNIARSENGNDAATVQQVKDLVGGVTYTFGNGLTVNGKTVSVKAGNGITVGQDGVSVKVSDKNLTADENGLKLSNIVTIGTSGTDAYPVTIDGTRGTVSGLSNTTWDEKTNNYADSSRAATEGQVKQAVDQAKQDIQKDIADTDSHIKSGTYEIKDNKVSMDIVDKDGKTVTGNVTINDVAKASDMGDISKLNDDIKKQSGTTTIIDAVNNVDNKIGDRKYSTHNAVSDGETITDSIGKLDKAIGEAKAEAGKHSTVSAGDSNIKIDHKDGDSNYAVSLNKDISVDSVTAKTAAIGGVTIKDNTISGLADTEIKSDSTDAVNSETIYKELRPESDGAYIHKDHTTAQNLSDLDTQVKKTSDLINSDRKTIKIGGSDTATKIDVSGKGNTQRVITGVQTDVNDPTSVANVGYVNEMSAANTQQIYKAIDSAYGHLNRNISKAAAGSNALAALHPMDTDSGDKASYAVGFGHYRNANAVAMGAFYRPNDNTMVSLGVSMGNGDTGMNAGVSFKVGKGSAYNGVSKAEMARTIDADSQKIAAQQKEIEAMKADNEAKDKRIDALEKQMQEIMAKMK